ncbi:unnamed protein product [Ilex paraguariensis]|uniref:CBF1-interacting co-repressor CIR N-terminal domain-containing protein n=1 Tax=Ilex paraguariensis TaxID=185542 RepID=A0ABC8U7V4_9AQUA
MALKFLNKKGWHTGSLRNIENVWKAEQKHDAEQKKLEELRKQIQEERERSEFRLLQEQAGLVPKQERLDFLYESGLAVGKGSSSGFKALESLPKTDSEAASSSSSKQQPAVPGALFEEKPQSANDTWRKLHSDPLLLIRQREQEALARVKNNPIQMAIIRKSVEAKKHKEKSHDGKEHRKKHHHKKLKNSSSKHHSDPEDGDVKGDKHRNTSDHKHSKYDETLYKAAPNLIEESSGRDIQRKKNTDKDSKYKERRPTSMSDRTNERIESQYRSKRYRDNSESENRYSERQVESDYAKRREDRQFRQASGSSDMPPQTESHHKRRHPIKISEEERATMLREMQMDAELHEEQRWKRLKKAEENDVQEATRGHTAGGKNFLHAAQKSIYGAEKGGSSTIEESVRRRTHYLQGKSEVEGNAFRR